MWGFIKRSECDIETSIDRVNAQNPICAAVCMHRAWGCLLFAPNRKDVTGKADVNQA